MMKAKQTEQYDATITLQTPTSAGTASNRVSVHRSFTLGVTVDPSNATVSDPPSCSPAPPQQPTTTHNGGNWGWSYELAANTAYDLVVTAQSTGMPAQLPVFIQTGNT
jgi:hypothetical protein